MIENDDDLFKNFAGEEEESEDILKDIKMPAYFIYQNWESDDNSILFLPYFLKTILIGVFLFSFQRIRRNKNCDEFDKVGCITFHSSVKIRKAERLDILVFEGFEIDLEYLVAKKNIPFFEINITRDRTQFLAKNDIRRISISDITILIELTESSLFRKCTDINGWQSSFRERNFEQILEFEMRCEISNRK